MPYIGNSKDKSTAYAFERDLLLTGLSYAEIAEKTGDRQKSISERNRLIHKVNIWDAFASRCAREGIPSRMPADSAFCSWFSGFFDGEGSIIVFTRPCSGRAQYSEFRLGVRIQIRDDDASTIEYLLDKIGCGTISRHNRIGATMPSIAWRCEKIQDLMETIVPIFDTYPLRTKKGKEFALFRPLVVQRYIDTLGGYSNRKGVIPQVIDSHTRRHISRRPAHVRKLHT
jgi:hypothetical protein